MTNDRTASRKDLFLRGAGSYVDALAALEAIEQAVEDMCRKAYSRHKDPLLATMGLDEGGDWERHTNCDPAERWAEVGTYRGTAKKGVSGPCFYIYLRFGEGEDDTREMSALVWLDFPSKGSREEVYNQIRRKNQRCPIEPHDEGDWYALVLEIPFKLTDLASTAETLDKLLCDWIGYCESIGGLK